MNNQTAILACDWLYPDQETVPTQKIQEVTTMVSRLAGWVVSAYALSAADMAGSHIITGSHYGRSEFIQKGGEQAARLGYMDYCNPNYFVHSISSAVAGQAAIDHGIAREAVHINTGHLSGLDAIGLAHESALVTGDFFFAAGADSAAAIEAAQENQHRQVKGGAGLVLLCDTNRLPGGTQPQGYILDYFSGYQAEADAAYYRHTRQQLLQQAGDSGSALLVIDCGDTGIEKLIRTVPETMEHYVYLPDWLADTGGASGAIALAWLLQGHPPFDGILQASASWLVVLAGGDGHQMYSHLIIQLP
jgi:hypothetical protein